MEVAEEGIGIRIEDDALVTEDGCINLSSEIIKEVTELSKNGYGITFSSELNNNQDTAVGLALKTLEDTDWEVISIDLSTGQPQDVIIERI